MDQPDLAKRLHIQALKGIGRLNFFSGSRRILWPALRDLASQRGPIRVLDLACGGGDVTIALWRRAVRAGLTFHIDGCDRSEIAVNFARRQAERQQARVGFFLLDVLTDPIPSGYDAVICSLFLHHLATDEAVSVLAGMAQSSNLVLVNDLRRSVAGYLLAIVATQLLTPSRVVQTDGPRSARAAFTVREMQELADRAGLIGATVEPRRPCRLLLTWRRPDS